MRMEDGRNPKRALLGTWAVSYTHLDVYKRQVLCVCVYVLLNTFNPSKYNVFLVTK